MFIQLAAAALFWSNFLVLAQGQGQIGDFDQIPTCAQSCVAAVAKNRNCALATANCLCPGQGDMTNCIEQECAESLPDLSTSLSIVSAFCLGATSSSTTSSSKSLVILSPPIIPSSASSTLASLTLSSLTTSISGTTSLTQSPLPLTQLSLVSSTTSTISTIVPTSSTNPLVTTPSITLTVPPPLSSSTSQAQPTVVVFSTQFAPPSNGGSVSGYATIGTIISILISGLVGIFML